MSSRGAAAITPRLGVEAVSAKGLWRWLIAAATTLVFALALPTGASAGSCPSGKVTADGPCGMDLEDAFSHYSTGNSEEIVAYIEGGINWHSSTAHEYVDNIYVNWHELPVPCSGASVQTATMVIGGVTEPCHTVYSSSFADYDANHDGVVNVQDWASDPRVNDDADGSGYLNPQDLIAAFSDGSDHDHDGYVNDISGWDFYDNQNDPATEDTTYGHSDGQMAVIHRECPKCMILPIRAGNEALDRTDDLAQAWLFAADAGASVIVSVTADLGYSSFMREAINYIESKGVAMVEASNDFDSTDHQGGMFHQDVLPGNGAVPQLVTEEEWTRSDYTSWGAHNILTAADPSGGGTTSESTPTLGGAIALTQAYSREAAAKGLISAPLNGPETEQELIATAKRVTNESLPWPGGPGEWNPQYGYGIPDVYDAMKAITANSVPPVARIESPEWYSLFDPTTKTGKKPLRVTGSILAPRAKRFKWVLEAGLGPNPQTWFKIGKGKGKGSRAGKLGKLKLSSIPESFWRAAFSLSSSKELETAEQYTVMLRLKVTDSSGRVGVDRRAISVYHDPSWLSGFPVKLSSSGESQPALADLQGTGRLDAVFGTTDGYVDAIDPATGKELPGWPVHTDAVSTVVSHEGVDPGYEAIFADVAVGDLNHTGELDVVAATEAGRVFVWNAKGELQPGWPQVCDTGVTPLPIPRPADPYTRLPIQGSVSPPVLYALGGGSKLDVVEDGWDGYVHVWEPNGSNLAGWPVKVQLPEGTKPESEYDIINDQKLDSPPAIAYLEGKASAPDLIVRPQYTETKGSGVQELPYAFVFAYHANGTSVTGWPAKLPGTIEYYGSAQEFITEGTSTPVAAEPAGTGLGDDDVALSPIFSPPYLLDGEGKILSTYGPTGKGAPTTFTTSPAFGKVGAAELMSLSVADISASSLAVALDEPGAASGEPIEDEETSGPAVGGADSPGYPAKRQGLDFLGEPIIAPVSSEGGAAVVDGGDSAAMQAYGTEGSEPSGFPKWTTGWTVFSPSTGDLLSDGRVDLVSTTREGYLMVWTTSGPAKGNDQWWRYSHDEWNTSNYEAVTRPPGVIRAPSFNSSSATVSFTAPGSTWYEGTPSSYLLALQPQDTTETAPASAAAGSTQTLQLPAGTTSVAIQAVGPSGLLGQAVLVGAGHASRTAAGGRRNRTRARLRASRAEGQLQPARRRRSVGGRRARSGASPTRT